ncbi:MAG: efflux RND transporter periplasmic adaptor subunit [Desulfamplus sp.]|nr:efflux RND transporter periplasmic adaptor subunit [Desulfamplus sp.]
MVLALAMLTGFTGCEDRKKSSQPQQQQQAMIPEVSTVTVELQEITLKTELPGRTSPFRIAEIRPQVSGLILKRLFTEGSTVKAGQELYRIDPTPFESALNNAKANLTASKKGAERAKAAIGASRAVIAQKKATLELAKTNLERFKEAFKERAISTSQRDQAETEVKVAEAMLQAAEAQLNSDQQAVAVAEASIEQAEAALETARINLAYTRINAPISGHIGISSVTEGAIVTAYQPVALTTIQQIDPIYVDVPQSTNELLNLRTRLEDGRLDRDKSNHDKVGLIFGENMQYQHEGKLQFSDVTVDPTTGSVTLRIIFPNPDDLLLPGMFVKTTIKEGVNKQAILIPQQGVSRDFKGNPVALIVDDKNKVQQRSLTLDRAVGNQWLVSSGLLQGDKLIVEGMHRVRAGAEVKDIPFKEAK